MRVESMIQNEIEGILRNKDKFNLNENSLMWRKYFFQKQQFINFERFVDLFLLHQKLKFYCFKRHE